MTNYKWINIQDLPDDWESLVSKELEALTPLWKEQAEKLKNSESLRIFNEKLAREWSIETGYIENLYNLDRGITQILIEKGIESSLISHESTNLAPDKLVSILNDQKDALEGIFDYVKNNKSLTNFFIRQLHEKFTKNQTTIKAQTSSGDLVEVPLLKGQWKQLPNNPKRANGKIHEYCPPEHVASEMDMLIEFHLKHIINNVSPELEAAWIHHRFTQIHPFQDGNGRVARALASLVFIKNGWFPLIINRDQRSDYIDALEKADQGDLKPLVLLFANIQKKAFIKALSLSESVLQVGRHEDVLIQAAIDKLKNRQREQIKRFEEVHKFSNILEKQLKEHFDNISNQISIEMSKINSEYKSYTDRSSELNNHYYRHQIYEIAKKYDYYADLKAYREWIRLSIKEESKTNIVVSFHQIGYNFIGIMACTAFYEYREEPGNDLSQETPEYLDSTYVSEPVPLTKDLFQFSFNESFENILERFEKWMEEMTMNALDNWRKNI